MLPFMALPGRIAVCLVATILLHGLVLRPSWKAMRGTRRALIESEPQIAPVQVQIYLESLCIDSKRYVLDQLVPAYQIIAPIIDLEIVSFGNAEIVNGTQVICQHGEAECDANLYQECASALFPSSLYISFYACLFDQLPMGHSDERFGRSVFRECAWKARMDPDPIQECHDHHAWWALSKAAAATPPRKGVPWVVLNGLHVDESQDLVAQVCNLYQQAGGHFDGCASRRVFV